MRTSEPRPPDGARLLAAAVILLVLPGCRVPGQSPSPTPSAPGSTPRPFTVMSTDPIRVDRPGGDDRSVRRRCCPSTCSSG